MPPGPAPSNPCGIHPQIPLRRLFIYQDLDGKEVLAGKLGVKVLY
jgi:hypothetical protein